MSIRWEWEEADLEVGAYLPDDEDFVNGDELDKPAIVLGGRTGGGLVIQGTVLDLVVMATRILEAAMTLLLPDDDTD